MYNVITVGSEFPAGHYHSYHRQCHQDSTCQGRDSGSEQSQFREASHTVDEHPVAQDVHDVTAYHRPHRHLSLSDSVEELLHGIEDSHEEHRCQIHQKVRADKLQQFLRLSDMCQVEIEQDEGKGEDASRQHVGKEGVAHLLTDDVGAFLSVESADDRSEAVGESHIGYKNETEDIVYQSCCRQFGGTVMTDHQRVGESQNDGSQLSDDDRKTYRKQFAVMMFLVHCHCFTMVVYIAF